jgi:hypothetical protein
MHFRLLAWSLPAGVQPTLPYQVNPQGSKKVQNKHFKSVDDEQISDYNDFGEIQIILSYL